MNHLTTNGRTENRYFQKLLNFVRPEGLRCPRCGHQDGFRRCRRHTESWIPDYRCPHCHHVFNAWTGTPFQGTHHPPSRLWRIIMQIKEGIFTTEIARELDCQRAHLSEFRHQIQHWMTSVFGPPPKKSPRRKVASKAKKPRSAHKGWPRLYSSNGSRARAFGTYCVKMANRVVLVIDNHLPRRSMGMPFTKVWPRRISPMLLDRLGLMPARNGRLMLVASLAFSGVFGYLFASWVIRSSITPVAFADTDLSEAKTLLVPSDENLDLGTIPRGAHREVPFWLENPGSKTVEIATITTSCECFEVILERTTIAGGEKIKATAKVDLTDDPDFAGSLGLRTEGKVNDQDVLAFVIRAKVAVGGPREHLAH